MVQKRAWQKKFDPQHFGAPAGGSRGLSRAARILAQLLEML
jgi:hypothetical protein